jgi:hypothetical protein
MDAKQVIRGEDGVMRCRECGFGYALAPAELVARTGKGLEAVERALKDVPEAFRAKRPRPAVWSVNAYVAHLADTGPVINSRVRAMAEHDRPSLRYHDENRAVEESHADSIPADSSLERLRGETEAFQKYVSALPSEAWNRAGVHERAGEVRLGEIAHDFPHELHHHAMDIRSIGAEVAASKS